MRSKPDGLLHLETMLASAGAKNFRPKAAFLVEAAKPGAHPNAELVERYIEEILYMLRRVPFLPGRDEEFWQSTGGQVMIEAAWAIRPDDLITPADAARLLYSDNTKNQTHRMNKLATLVNRGELKAYARPESLRSRTSRYRNIAVGIEGRVRWYVRRSEVEKLAASRLEAAGD